MMIDNGEWYFRAWRGVHSWVAYAKRTPFTVPEDRPYREAFLIEGVEENDIFFEFGKTPEEALAKVKASVLT